MKTYIDILMEAIEGGPPVLLSKQLQKKRKKKKAAPKSDSNPLSGLLDNSGSSES